VVKSDKNVFGRHLAARVVLSLQQLLSEHPDGVTSEQLRNHIANSYGITDGYELRNLKARIATITREMILDGTLIHEELKSKKKVTYYVFKALKTP
jgi:hypothetical protein